MGRSRRSRKRARAKAAKAPLTRKKVKGKHKKDKQKEQSASAPARKQNDFEHTLGEIRYAILTIFRIVQEILPYCGKESSRMLVVNHVERTLLKFIKAELSYVETGKLIVAVVADASPYITPAQFIGVCNDLQKIVDEKLQKFNESLTEDFVKRSRTYICVKAEIIRLLEESRARPWDRAADELCEFRTRRMRDIELENLFKLLDKWLPFGYNFDEDFRHLGTPIYPDEQDNSDESDGESDYSSEGDQDDEDDEDDDEDDSITEDAEGDEGNEGEPIVKSGNEEESTIENGEADNGQPIIKSGNENEPVIANAQEDDDENVTESDEEPNPLNGNDQEDEDDIVTESDGETDLSIENEQEDEDDNTTESDGETDISTENEQEDEDENVTESDGETDISIENGQEDYVVTEEEFENAETRNYAFVNSVDAEEIEHNLAEYEEEGNQRAHQEERCLFCEPVAYETAEHESDGHWEKYVPDCSTEESSDDDAASEITVIGEQLEDLEISDEGEKEDPIPVVDLIPDFDPLTLNPLADPVVNKVCGHVYGKAAMIEAIRENLKTRCPVNFCTNKAYVKITDLVHDPEVSAKVAAKLPKKETEIEPEPPAQMNKKAGGRRRRRH